MASLYSNYKDFSPVLCPLKDFAATLPFLGLLQLFLIRTSLPFLGFVGHSCHFLAFLDIPIISWLSRTSLPFSGFPGHFCHFLAFSDISAIS
ncbi:hypothetical protein Taro_009136 [Colocasia esculenta]|uniref:Uncharacterized protein n=1 Tax=Colocasia esculenta TaxID=4460 RepID=A0A843U3X9_COLES|nr:hypothetical protein [Colocasia esculenta]